MNGTPTLDADNPDQVANASTMEIVVDGPGDINRLFIFTGTALVNFERDESEDPGTQVIEIQIILEKNLPSKKDFRGSATFASHGEIENDGSYTDDYGMAVLDSTTIAKDDGALRLVAHLEVRHDAKIGRMAYQANVVASLNG